MSWKDAYRLRADVISSGLKSARADQAAADASISASKLGQAAFRKDVKQTLASLKQPEKTAERQTNEALDASIKKGGIEGFLASAGKVAEQPGIKTALNVLSTGTYASANTSNNFMDAIDNIKDGNLRGVSDFALAPLTGIAQGVSAGIGQNSEDVKTYSELIKRGQEMAGVDTENDAAKWGQGLGGFIADVGLDPLTYATFGVTAAAKGASRGLAEGAKGAKQIAEEAIAKSPDIADTIPANATKTMQEIADNPKGRIFTALEEASKDHRSWKTARAKYKQDKKDIKARAKEGVNGSVSGERVGGLDIAQLEKENALRVNAELAKHHDELERQIEAEVASTPAPSAESVIKEVIEEKAPVVEPVKIEATPVKVDDSLPVKFTEAVKDAVEAAPVALPKPPGINKNVEMFNQLENSWVAPKYSKAMKELLEPGEATITRQIPASQLADPAIAAKYGIDPAQYADPATHYLPRGEKSVDFVDKSESFSTSEYIGLGAEAKEKKRIQANTATGKKNARIKEEELDWTLAPKQKDETPFVGPDDEPVVPVSENFEEYVDLNALQEFSNANPKYKLFGDPSAKGKIGTTLDKFLDNIGGTSAVTNNIIENNLFFFAKFADENQGLDPEILDGVRAVFDEKMEAFMGSGKATPVETPDIDAPKEVMEDLGPLEALMVDVTEANPKAWSPARAAELGINPDDGILSPAEIAALSIPMTNRQIAAKIKRKENGMTKGEMDIIRAVTGLGPKATPDELATKFVQLRMAHKKELKAAEKPAKVLAQTKAEEVARITNPDEALRPIQATDEHIASIREDTAELANDFVASPTAFDEPYQMELRRLSYVNALTDRTHDLGETLLKIVDPETGRIGKLAINDYAHKAVKNALAVQLKEADFLTNTGMRTLTDDKTTGGAWSPKIWGSNSQQALHNSIIRSMREQIEAGSLNKYNGTEKRKFYMATLKVSDAELRAAGVEPFLNHVDDIPGKARTNVSLYDMFAALDEQGQAKAILDKHIFGRPSDSFNITQLQDSFETMMRMRNAGKSEAAIRTRIKSQLTSSQAHHGRPVANDLAATDNTARRLGYIVDFNKSLEDMDAKTAVRTAKRLDGVSASKIADALLDPGVYRALSYRRMINAAAHNSSLGDYAAKYADNMVERLYQMADTVGPGAALKLFTAESRKLRAGISAADYDKAKDALDLKMAEFLSEAERLGVNTATKRADLAAPVAKTVDGEKVNTAPQPNIENAVAKSHVEDAKAAEKEVEGMPKPADAEPFEMGAAAIANAAYRKMHPIQRLVNPRLGLDSDAYRAVNSGLHSIARQQAHFHQSLSMHLERYSAQTLRTDFEDLQKLARVHDSKNPMTFPEGVPESQRELYGIMQTMLEVSGQNVFARNAVGVKHFNALARTNGLAESWRYEEGLSIYDNTHLWASKWEGIGEKGVLDFLSKMHSVAVKASQEIAIGASFSKQFGKTTREPGYVKLVWNNQSKAQRSEPSLFNLIDHDLYYPKEIASQVIQVDKLMRETRSLDTSKPFGKFMVNVFDPITNALKASQTTVRPGHWTVSVAGDLLRNQIAGVNSIQPYRHALRIMKTGGIDTSDFSGKILSAESLAKYRKGAEVAQGFTANGEATGMHFYVGGKKANVSYETLEKILHDVVMLPKHRGGGGVIEDRFVGENVTNKLSRRLEKATDFVTDNEKFSLNALAAKRDNFMRISLAVDYASKRKWANLTEMKKGMEDYITKWAPISTDMTSFESKYARRSMLYYTWLRGITPRMIDAAVTKPGVATMVPKALYNMAYANGVNPESIGNPFPEDGMFPSYYRDNVLGPQWRDDNGLWGINPSSPIIEVANTFKNFKPGDPVGNAIGGVTQAIGMSTPFAKIPIELGMGAQSSGVPIEDPAQYALDNLGGSYIAALSRATGKTLNTNGIVDRTDGAAKFTPDEQGEQAALQGINFLTGAKLTDYESLGAAKAANYELREKMRAKVEAEARKG